VIDDGEMASSHGIQRAVREPKNETWEKKASQGGGRREEGGVHIRRAGESARTALLTPSARQPLTQQLTALVLPAVP